MKFFCFFDGSFFKIKIGEIFYFQWIKYLGKDLSYFKNWGIEVNYCWNYGPSNLLLHFTEYCLDQLNNMKIAVNSTIQNLESCSHKKCLLKIFWSTHHKMTTLLFFLKIERKPSFNSQCFQTSQISGIWFNENA